MTRIFSLQKEKAKDFKSQIIKYLEAMLQSQQRVIITPKEVLYQASMVSMKCSFLFQLLKKQKVIHCFSLPWQEQLETFSCDTFGLTVLMT